MIIYFIIYNIWSWYRFLDSKEPPLITKQKPSTDSIHHYGLDNPMFVSDLSNTISTPKMPINDQSVYLKTPESKFYSRNEELT